MGTKNVNRMFRAHLTGTNQPEWIVLVVLCQLLKDADERHHVKIDNIVGPTMLGERQVNKALDTLHAKGYINYSQNRFRVVTYSLIFESAAKPEKKGPTPEQIAEEAAKAKEEAIKDKPKEAAAAAKIPTNMWARIW